MNEATYKFIMAHIDAAVDSFNLAARITYLEQQVQAERAAREQMELEVKQLTAALTAAAASHA
jgi:hypothetical protein